VRAQYTETTCYMCDALATSSEHAPPQCLFPEQSSFGSNLRKNLITVPSCDLHNSKKSEDDEFLRATLCLAAAGESTIATHQFFDKVMRGAKRSPVKYNSYAPPVNAVAPPGKAIFKTDRARFDRCVVQIAKAVCFYTFKRKWLLDVAVVSPQLLTTSSNSELVSHYPSLGAMQATRDFLSAEPVCGENGEVFKYRIKVDNDMFAFGAIFYERFEVFAASSPTIARDMQSVQ
jgi:hypothetical protein